MSSYPTTQAYTHSPAGPAPGGPAPAQGQVYNEGEAYYRAAPQPAAGAQATYGRQPFNPQFQRGVHSAEVNMPKGAAPAAPPVGAGYSSFPVQAQARAISSRIASTNAAIAAIQSVTSPVIRPVPRNRPSMAVAGLPQLPGGDIKGTIRFDQDSSVAVVDEVTAQRSAADFSEFLGRTRKHRNKQWDGFWRYRSNVNRHILLEENECFKEAQEDANDFEDSDEEDAPRRVKPIIVPYIYHNVGSFDVPRPPSVVMPDPELITLRLQAQQTSQAQAQAQQLQAQQAQQVQQAQQIQVMRQQQMSARQRAAQQVKMYERRY